MSAAIAASRLVGRLAGMHPHLASAPTAVAGEPGDYPRVVVVGGGIAGACAAVVLAERGLPVVVCEAADRLGGRLGAHPHVLPDGTEQWVDHGFHGFFRQYYNWRKILGRISPGPEPLLHRHQRRQRHPRRPRAPDGASVVRAAQRPPGPPVDGDDAARPGPPGPCQATGEERSAVDHWQYLTVLAACVAVTLPLEVIGGARVYRRPRALLAVLAPVVAVFAGWDLIAVHRGDWWFSARYTLAPRLAGLPLEEWLFFLVVPVCALLTYEVLGRGTHGFRSRGRRRAGR